MKITEIEFKGLTNNDKDSLGMKTYPRAELGPYDCS